MKKTKLLPLLPDTNIIQTLVNTPESTLKNIKSLYTTINVNIESVFV